MKKNISILALIFALFGIVSSDAFDEKDIGTPTPGQFPEFEHNRQYPPGIKDIKGVESRASGFMKKGDRIKSNDDYLVDSVTIHIINPFTEDLYTNKYIYDYNDNNQILTEIGYGWVNDEWVNFFRSNYTYDENGNRLTYLSEYLENEEWAHHERETYTYDAAGNCLTYERWDNKSWPSRNTYVYDSVGNLLIWIYEKWKTDEWVNDERDTYAYDSVGNLLTSLSEAWANDKWVNSSRDTYTYDSLGNQLTYLYEYWKNDEWVNCDRYTYTYDDNGNLIIMLHEDYWENDGWEYRGKSTYTYDTTGNILVYFGEYKYREDEPWAWYYSETYTYDAAGNRLTYLSERCQFCQPQYQGWNYIRRYTYTYDAAGNHITLFAERWKYQGWAINDCMDAEYQFQALLSFEDSYGNEYSYDCCYKIDIAWKKSITSVESNSGDVIPITTFPNPFTNSTTIKYNLDAPAYTRIKLYNMLGIEVAEYGNEFMAGGRHTLVVNGSGLTNGVYIIVLEAGGRRSSKLIHKVR